MAANRARIEVQQSVEAPNELPGKGNERPICESNVVAVLYSSLEQLIVMSRFVSSLVICIPFPFLH